MVKGAKLLTIFLILLCASIIPVAFISGCMADNNTMNVNATPTPTTNVAVKGMYLQYYSPDIELQTSYISDTLEAGKTYVYKVQVKNVGNKSITIEPRFNANYPIIYPMAASSSGQGSSTRTVSNASGLIDTSAAVPVISSGVSNASGASSASGVSTAMPMIPYNNGQAFDNDAINISVPSTIKAGEIVDMVITVKVPENATGNYYRTIDMNVNKEENSPYNPQLSLSFTVQQPLTMPYMKNFSTKTNAPILIELSADSYIISDTRNSPAIEKPSFDVGLTCNSNPVNLTLVKRVESGNVGTGVIYPKWASETGNTYQSYSNHYVQTYSAQGAIGDWQLSILPKNTNNFGYSITIGSSS